ncbi:exopolyphosphatase / guanosine-5'-triphosphate,3'-diphosphate pyrophosphatase [Saccharicrinis carchari]|uniref:Exopolyphosphatase / guanosine-5'-triphosphate,3'-diphosphate pyrophosphatase n=1 Tax=Saccharicrinis carchari TaxID=1168039 RepID=A0A521D7G5_SACCC|nr:phosphatase [Saccharicrinis carchari]SMO66840.1 exopolyphosphatase / guanosine-5'-triphosphate,3'-diphosphate pyrophosphatase [Saccharicrinis carchari]
MHIAIIDLGTNTFNLLIVRVNRDNDYTILFENKHPTKLGKGGINKNTITPEAFERGFVALQTHLDTIKKFDVDRIHCFATSAIRSSSNGKEFVAAVKDKFGLDIMVIQGAQEAELIYDGVKQVFPIGAENVLIMDIGGGSTEFIIANVKGVQWKQSFELGVARIFDQVNPSAPMQSKQVEQVNTMILDSLEPLFYQLKQQPIGALVGSSGSFDIIAAMVAAHVHPHLTMSKLTSYKIMKTDFEALNATFLNTTIEERLKLEAMDVDRVEVIVLASVFIKFMVNHLGLNHFYQCNYALKEGAIYQILNNKLKVSR